MRFEPFFMIDRQCSKTLSKFTASTILRYSVLLLDPQVASGKYDKETFVPARLAIVTVFHLDGRDGVSIWSVPDGSDEKLYFLKVHTLLRRAHRRLFGADEKA